MSSAFELKSTVTLYRDTKTVLLPPPKKNNKTKQTFAFIAKN